MPDPVREKALRLINVRGMCTIWRTAVSDDMDAIMPRGVPSEGRYRRSHGANFLTVGACGEHENETGSIYTVPVV